ncbi:MAG: endonuclease/exonuclease/phosphatase family protein [Deltaproteobacteria bacterium]|nr:endonuclease/exonuclease/phosphatase family protein [Deltaproteobacteria bacterium]MBW2396890.1 endonuclease/exonuclease/phosphatase family protein [Deltaproteobacteria bacterium]
MTPYLRLMTANLFNGRARPEAIAQLIERLEVDVACFQELAPEQAEAIQTVLPFGKLDPRTDHEGAGIALRHPGQVDRLPLPDRDARVTHLDPRDWPLLDTPLEVVAVHLQAPHGNPPPWITLPRRRGQIAGLVDYFESVPHPHRVVAGDFNATPLWPAYRRLCQHLTDGPHALARSRGRRPSPTWGPAFAAGRRLLRIDHIFTGGVELIECTLHPIEGSDHSALIADLA